MTSNVLEENELQDRQTRGGGTLKNARGCSLKSILYLSPPTSRRGDKHQNVATRFVSSKGRFLRSLVKGMLAQSYKNFSKVLLPPGSIRKAILNLSYLRDNKQTCWTRKAVRRCSSLRQSWLYSSKRELCGAFSLQEIKMFSFLDIFQIYHSTEFKTVNRVRFLSRETKISLNLLRGVRHDDSK